MASRSDFMYARSRYRGEVKPQNLVFDANLQEFAQRVSYICALETNGKLSPEESFAELNQLWEQLADSKKALGIGENPFAPES